jgi:hypothetical protein
LIVQLEVAVADGSLELKTNGVPSFGLAALTIVRKPLFGAKTQSDGSEFG